MWELPLTILLWELVVLAAVGFALYVADCIELYEAKQRDRKAESARLSMRGEPLG
jgi:hypothetical protein